MQNVTIAALAVWLTACAGLVQTGSLSEAYKKLDEGKYSQMLQLLSLADNAKGTDADTLAEIAYLKAQVYEGLGENEKARSLYRYLAEQHPDSRWGYLASTMLD